MANKDGKQIAGGQGSEEPFQLSFVGGQLGTDVVLLVESAFEYGIGVDNHDSQSWGSSLGGNLDYVVLSGEYPVRILECRLGVVKQNVVVPKSSIHGFGVTVDNVTLEIHLVFPVLVKVVTGGNHELDLIILVDLLGDKSLCGRRLAINPPATKECKLLVAGHG